MCTRLVFFLPFFLLLGFCFGQQKPSFDFDKLDIIASADVPQDAPGIATGIIFEGKQIYTKYAGFRDLEERQDINEETRFNIASMAKQFTALAILMLEKEGKLKLEDDFRIYLPEIYSKVSHKITLKHLLSHSSGIRDVYALWSLKGIVWWKETLRNEDALKILSDQETLNFNPGEHFEYSNSNYILLAEVIEKVAEDGFYSFTDDMFAKLGMKGTSFTRDYTKINGPIAKPYFNFDEWQGYEWTCDIVGDGNLFSTLEDQLQWERIIQTGGNDWVNSSVINKSQLLFDSIDHREYGFGLQHGIYNDIPYKYHEGATGAWKSITVRFPQEDLSIVTLTNSGKVIPTYQTMLMVNEIFNIKDSKPTFPIQPDKEGDFIEIQELMGNYITPEGYFVRLIDKEGDLYLLRSNRNDTKLIRENANTTQQWNDKAFKQQFKKNEQGEMEVTFYYPSVPPFTLTKIDFEADSLDKSLLGKEYINRELGVALKIDMEKTGGLSVILGENTMDAIALSNTRIKAGNYMLEIDKTKDGKTSILLNTDRLDQVIFSSNE
ncbi:serine hydrolase domain-containing protein [Portibacter marinus]|uniref:serine hydrolase domain-containing protein n=1 Tax=Portibacter marinus TaxID=2898660 RepID=UPI001F25E2CE|nr:serine hydrolase domain-containing protein [Portibacter marinus]